MSLSHPRTRRHVHLYFCTWQHESRAWRAGASALDAGLTDEVTYYGHRAEGLPDEERIDSRQVIRRIGAKPSRPGSFRLLRALSLPRWWTAVQTTCPKDIALVTAHSLAALPAGVLLSRRTGAPLLYDAHELETEREGWSPAIRRIAKVVERALIRWCDHTIVVNDSIRSWYEDAYPGLSVSTVRNVPVIPKAIGPSTLREAIGISKEPLLYVYCGLLDKGRGLTEMIRTFATVRPGIHLVFVGFGPLEEEVKSAVRSHPNIHFHPAVTQQQLIALLSGADVGVFLPDGGSASYQNSLPNKVFEYSAAKLGILVSDARELKRFASEYPLAKSVPVSVDQIRAAVDGWSVQEIRSTRATMEFTPPTWDKEVAKLMEAYATVARRHAERAGAPRPRAARGAD